MKVIILAAGIGKRMWPIVTDKYLLPFLGRPLFHHTLKKVKDAIDFEEVIIITKEQTKDEISQIASDLGVNFKIAIQSEANGMAGAILSAKEYINGTVLIINAEDILEENAYQDVLETGIEGKADVVFSALEVEGYFPGGYLKVESGKVVGIVEKPGAGQEPSKLVKVVADYFKDGEKLISYLQSSFSDKDDVYEVALGKMIADGLDVEFTQYNGEWLPIKYPWHILSFTESFLKKLKREIHPSVKIADSAKIEGEVVIEEGAKVFEGAVIKGPVFIGKNCIIGTNSIVRESIIEEGSVTGFNSDITRSYIGANSWFHTNYIGDSVIEGDFGMGSGAVLANLRLDNQTIKLGEEKLDTGRTKLGLIVGKGSRVGVNASTMPGVRVGSGSLVGPGVVLHEDVKDNTKIILKQEYEVSEHTPVLTSYDQFREKI